MTSRRRTTGPSVAVRSDASRSAFRERARRAATARRRTGLLPHPASDAEGRVHGLRAAARSCERSRRRVHRARAADRIELNTEELGPTAPRMESSMATEQRPRNGRLHQKHPERISRGCDRHCRADDLDCGNGFIRTPYPIELFGETWCADETAGRSASPCDSRELEPNGGRT